MRSATEMNAEAAVVLYPAPIICPHETKIYVRKLKNRISARTSRQRQKDYIEFLETENANLRQEIILIREMLSKLNK